MRSVLALASAAALGCTFDYDGAFASSASAAAAGGGAGSTSSSSSTGVGGGGGVACGDEAPCLFVDTGSDVKALAVDDGWIYYETGDAIWRVSKEDASRQPLATGIVTSRIVVGDASLNWMLWEGNGAIDGMWEIAKAPGGSAARIAELPPGVITCAFDARAHDDDIFWTVATFDKADQTGSLLRSSKGSLATPVVLETLTNPFGVAVDDTYAYLVEVDTTDTVTSLNRYLRDGSGGPELVASDSTTAVTTVVVDDARVFWGYVYPAAEMRWSLKEPGSTAQVIVQPSPYEGACCIPTMLSDGASGLYWLHHGAPDGSDGAILYFDTNAGDEEAAVVVPSLAFPRGMALDASYLYWSSAGGIWRVARPD